MVIAEHWIRFWQKSNQTLQTYVGLIREVCRKNASQYFFMEYDDLRGTSDKELMDDLTLKDVFIYSNGETTCGAESALVTTNHDLALLFRNGELVSVRFEG